MRRAQASDSRPKKFTPAVKRRKRKQERYRARAKRKDREGKKVHSNTRASTTALVAEQDQRRKRRRAAETDGTTMRENTTLITYRVEGKGDGRARVKMASTRAQHSGDSTERNHQRVVDAANATIGPTTDQCTPHSSPTTANNIQACSPNAGS